MKKHQKVLLGLMVLGLAGTVGTTFALTRKSATSSINGNGTDTAIYVTWGENATTDFAEVKDLEAKKPVYRYVVMQSNSSKSLAGTLSLTFALNVGQQEATVADTTNYVLTGLTVDIYSVDAYEKTSFSTEGEGATDTKLATLDATENTTCTHDVTITASEAAQTINKYYTLVFTWDGTPVGDGNTFGGYLAISQSFKE